LKARKACISNLSDLRDKGNVTRHKGLPGQWGRSVGNAGLELATVKEKKQAKKRFTGWTKGVLTDA